MLILTIIAASALVSTDQHRPRDTAPPVRIERPEPFYVRNRERAADERRHQIERDVRRVQHKIEDHDHDLDYEMDAAMDSDNDW